MRLQTTIFGFKFSLMMLVASGFAGGIAHAKKVEKPLAGVGMQDVAEQVQSNTEQFENLLNAQEKPEDLLKFLDAMISNEAQFFLTVDNDATDMKPAKLTLTKADYINSYLYGPRQVQNYQAQLGSEVLFVDHEAQTLVSRETLVESGTLKGPDGETAQKNAFETQTVCQNYYTIKAANQLEIKNSKCAVHIKTRQAS